MGMSEEKENGSLEHKRTGDNDRLATSMKSSTNSVHGHAALVGSNGNRVTHCDHHNKCASAAMLSRVGQSKLDTVRIGWSNILDDLDIPPPSRPEVNGALSEMHPRAGLAPSRSVSTPFQAGHLALQTSPITLDATKAEHCDRGTTPFNHHEYTTSTPYDESLAIDALISMTPGLSTAQIQPDQPFTSLSHLSGASCFSLGVAEVPAHLKAVWTAHPQLFQDPPTATMACKCKSTRCLKLYCNCFRTGRYCGLSCRCTHCHNTEHEDLLTMARSKSIEAILNRDPQAFQRQPVRKRAMPPCACKEIRCLQKYCSCVANEVQCTNNCRCRDCENPVSSSALSDSKEKQQEKKGGRTRCGR